MGATSDITGEGAGDTRWLTYRELARARGISAASAKRLAIRRHWRRQEGNDGTSRVAVPVTELRRVKPDTDDTSDIISDVTRAVTTLEATIAALQEQQERERAVLRELVDQQRTRAERSEQREEDLVVQLEAMQAELAAAKRAVEQAAQAALERAEEAQRAEDARRVRGTWARLRAAWRAE